MSKISAIRHNNGQQPRLKVFLDNKLAFSLEAEVAAKECLQVGQELSHSQIEALVKSNRFHRCLNVALHYLSYRPRSESELRKRLERHGFDIDDVEAILSRLKEQGLVNDMAFAQFWKDNRESFSPRSQWLIKSELKQKGLTADIIDQVVDETNDAESAYRAALSKTHSLSLSDYEDCHRRLGQYLKRRGFSYEVINQATKRIWQEQGGNSK